MTIDVQTFRADGTWGKPAGVLTSTMTRVKIQAGGGAGGGAVATNGVATYASGGDGGSSGSYVELWIPTAWLGNTSTVGVGAGGQGEAAATGGNGGNSYVSASLLEVEVVGGLGGALHIANQSANEFPFIGVGTPPNLAGADDGVFFDGTHGEDARVDAVLVVGSGGSPFVATRPNQARGGQGGGSYLGGGTRVSSTNGTGRVGNVYGGGGGGAANNNGQASTRRGGHAKPGIVVFETYL